MPRPLTAVERGHLVLVFPWLLLEQSPSTYQCIQDIFWRDTNDPVDLDFHSAENVQNFKIFQKYNVTITYLTVIYSINQEIITFAANSLRMVFLFLSNFPSTNSIMIGYFEFSQDSLQQHTVVGFQEYWRCDKKGGGGRFHDGCKIECFCILTVLEFVFSPFGFLIDSFNYKRLALDCNIVVSCNTKTVQSNETDGFLFPSDNGKGWSWTR